MAACSLHENQRMWTKANLARLGFWLVLASACQREAVAQVVDDPLSPIGCFKIVDDRGVASTTVIDLCAGATSIAPGLCYAAALDCCNLTSQQILQLCWGATSTDPLDCYRLLDAEGDLTNSQIIGYCAASCPLGPAPAQASHPWCVKTALDRTNLTTQMVGELCRNARSAGPVECFLVGRSISRLAESELVRLCAQTWSCQYVNANPPTN